MNDENTRRVIRACPSIFETIEDEQNKMSRGEMFMPIAFYFECGDGWADLLVELCEGIQKHIQTLPPEAVSELVALQVKEKYGTLRFYVSGYDKTLDKLIEDASKKSSVTCETCGAPGESRGDAWLYTACEQHTREYDLKKNQTQETP
jgi:hypothetical protein